ncbi:nucleotidyl transferase AbiEii/AbiGii toxin family protein [Dyadobacter sp. CY261]|uniref:nucleotidyl transferase AbiEii/AbiGii toxin family protein n=1 Tax=Dyadobacter sp. CY261 TaxID=2907203 RepID=UPI001F193937|nr:nucleotidyl transferase AbiEii/AbiGii toxin family protein [Dyadobacter sp. CY261]MCF0075213.1 nucleotidyl transferase AbiEii/AbiGii toxin family protein [Dyadobacter sp. CY261]
MNLHENKALFRQAIQATADRMRIPAIYVEKDYWVTYALFTIFENEIGDETIFKGGTALSKCFKKIERFSEDIDLVVLRKEGETDNRLKTKLKKISASIEPVLPEIELEGLTHKRGMNRKTAHLFPKEFAGTYGQIRDVIVLESTWLGNYEPYGEQTIVSFVDEMMLEANQEQIAAQYNLLPFTVQILSPLRTSCEKIMSLVRFSHTGTPIVDLRKKVRHIYDLYQLLQLEEYSQFLQSAEFEKMLTDVGIDDFKSFRNNNQWLRKHPMDAVIFSDLEITWNQIKDAYTREFRNLVFGKLPDDASILNCLKSIQSRLTTISWIEFE